MLQKTTLLSLLALLFLSPKMQAQDSEIGNWLLYFGNQKINNRFNFHNEVQYRNYNFAGDTDCILARI